MYIWKAILVTAWIYRYDDALPIDVITTYSSPYLLTTKFFLMLEKLDSSQLIGLGMVLLVLIIIATVLFFTMRKEKGY